jgi:hypothetical protein
MLPLPDVRIRQGQLQTPPPPVVCIAREVISTETVLKNPRKTQLQVLQLHTSRGKKHHPSNYHNCSHVKEEFLRRRAERISYGEDSSWVGLLLPVHDPVTLLGSSSARRSPPGANWATASAASAAQQPQQPQMGKWKECEQEPLRPKSTKQHDQEPYASGSSVKTMLRVTTVV